MNLNLQEQHRKGRSKITWRKMLENKKAGVAGRKWGEVKAMVSKSAGNTSSKPYTPTEGAKGKKKTILQSFKVAKKFFLLGYNKIIFSIIRQFEL